MAQIHHCTCNLCFEGTHYGVGPACNVKCDPYPARHPLKLFFSLAEVALFLYNVFLFQ